MCARIYFTEIRNIYINPSQLFAYVNIFHIIVFEVTSLNYLDLPQLLDFVFNFNKS